MGYLRCVECQKAAKHGEKQQIADVPVGQLWYCCPCYYLKYRRPATPKCRGCEVAADRLAPPPPEPAYRKHYRRWQLAGKVAGAFYCLAGMLQDGLYFLSSGSHSWPLYTCSYFLLAILCWGLCDFVSRRWEADL